MQSLGIDAGGGVVPRPGHPVVIVCIEIVMVGLHVPVVAADKRTIAVVFKGEGFADDAPLNRYGIGSLLAGDTLITCVSSTDVIDDNVFPVGDIDGIARGIGCSGINAYPDISDHNI